MFNYIVNLIIFVPLIICLIILSMKLTKINSDRINKHKYIRLLERINLSKEISIFVLEIGDEGYVLALSPSKIEKLKILSKEEIIQIHEMKENHNVNLSQIDINKLKNIKLALKNKR